MWLKLIGERVDDVRKAESAHGKTEAKKQLKKTLWLWRKNPSKRSSESEQARFDRIDHDYLGRLFKAYQICVLALSVFYNTIPYQQLGRAPTPEQLFGSTKSATKHLRS